MSGRLIFAGLFTEGKTDDRFLEPVVQRALRELAFECKGETEIEVRVISIDKSGLSFAEQVVKAAEKGYEDFGIMLLCVHTDADDRTDETIQRTKIEPAREALTEAETDVVLAALVPVPMTEAWMLADKELLKIQLGTHQSNRALNIDKAPEQTRNPKAVIEEAIRRAESERSKGRRRHQLDISELYQIMGQAMPAAKLDTLAAYRKFKDELRQALKQLNFL
mgnify:CR=1 FL=1